MVPTRGNGNFSNWQVTSVTSNIVYCAARAIRNVVFAEKRFEAGMSEAIVIVFLLGNPNRLLFMSARWCTHLLLALFPGDVLMLGKKKEFAERKTPIKTVAFLSKILTSWNSDKN